MRKPKLTQTDLDLIELISGSDREKGCDLTTDQICSSVGKKRTAVKSSITKLVKTGVLECSIIAGNKRLLKLLKTCTDRKSDPYQSSPYHAEHFPYSCRALPVFMPSTSRIHADLYRDKLNDKLKDKLIDKQKAESGNDSTFKSCGFKKFPRALDNSSCTVSREDVSHVLTLWKQMYKAHNGFNYLQGEHDAKHVTTLLGLMQVPELVEFINAAFLLQGCEEAWACNNRMVDFATFFKNYNKIKLETHKYKPPVESLLRPIVTINKETVKEAMRVAVGYVTMVCKSNEALLPFLQSCEHVDKVPSYARCILGHGSPKILKVHQEDAIQQLQDLDFPGFTQFLIQNNWYLGEICNGLN